MANRAVDADRVISLALAFLGILGTEAVQNIEDMAAFMERVQKDLTPLNTNIRIMYIFLLDYFSGKLDIPYWKDESLRQARRLLSEYREHHACAEFNSPTYCGVDLSTLGFWRRYGSTEELRLLGRELEEGIWQDMADFYNPSMRAFSGPYSRCYELDMSIHTCFYDILYLGLGAYRFPFHPFSIESVINPLTVLGDISIPESVAPRFLEPQAPRRVTRQFRELSERGDPDHNDALCTATGWISPRLMIGALAGSENPSHQLHPLVIFWRCGEEIGTVKLLRCWPNGGMHHMHTVYFNGVSRKKHIDMDIHTDVNRDVKYFYEIECPGAASSVITPDAWQLPGLTLHIAAKAPVPTVEIISDRVIRVCYLAEVEKPETMRMHFSMDAELQD